MPSKVVNPSEFLKHQWRKLPVFKAVELSFPTDIYFLLFWIENERWCLDRQLCCLLLSFNTRKTKLTIPSVFFHDICNFFIQDDSTKEERRDQRGRPRGKQREFKRKGRNQGRRHGREEASPGKRGIENESSYVGLRVRERI